MPATAAPYRELEARSGSAKTTYPPGTSEPASPATHGALPPSALRPHSSRAVAPTARYARPFRAYIVGMPSAPWGRSPVQSTAPVSASYARILPSRAVAKIRPVDVTTMLNRCEPRGMPVSRPPAASASLSCPSATFHLMTPAFRSYAVSDDQGGVMMNGNDRP